MQNSQLSQPIPEGYIVWGSLVGIIGFIQINFFIIPQVRPSDFFHVVEVAIYLNLLNVIILIFIFFFKFLKKWKKIVGSIFLIIVISSLSEFVSISPSVHLEIEPKKDHYKFGETVTAKTTVSNYTLMPLSLKLYRVVPQIWLYDDFEQSFQYPDKLEEPTSLHLLPFQTKTYETKLTLINNKDSFDDSGTSDNHDVIVRPGANIVQTLFFVFDGEQARINVAPYDFNQTIIPCENFTDEKRKQNCKEKNSL